MYQIIDVNNRILYQYKQYVSKGNWWRRRDSNPRPTVLHPWLYVLVPAFEFNPQTTRRDGVLEDEFPNLTNVAETLAVSDPVE